MAQLALPEAGSYVVFGKTEISNAHPSNRGVADCALQVGIDSNRGMLSLEPKGTGTDVGALTLTVVHQAGGPEAAAPRCNDYVGGTVSATNTKVAAIRVQSLTNTPG